MDDFTPLARRPGDAAEAWEDRLIGDMYARHERGARVPVETYLQHLPDLAASPAVAQNLLFAEWTLRRTAGESFDLPEYIRRFPQWETVMPLLWETDRQRVRLDDQPVRWPDWYTGPATFPVVFGAYRLLDEIGIGGMGRVFLAEPAEGGDRVVVKVPKFPVEQDPTSVARRRTLALRFDREARLTRELQHPRLCRALAVGECDGLPYFVMPYYPGGSVADELDARRPFDQRAAARLIAEAARALQYAHEHGILHRDLKPGNLLRDEHGRVIVTDFGLALQLDADDSRLTPSGHQQPGTWRYQSPEQIACNRDLGPASDIFSLGVVLYELLAGAPPFTGELAQLVHAITQASPPPLERRRPDVAPALAAICRKAMARQPEDRYASMADFAAALEHFLDPSRPPPVADTASVGARSRRRLPAVAAIAALLVLAAIITAWACFAGPATPPNPGGDPRPQAERLIVSTRKPVGIRGHLQAMHDDLAQLDAVKLRPHVRYFSLMAVHDNPYISDDDLNLHLEALHRVLKRLSRNQPDVRPFPVDAALLRVDLRDLGWHPALEWTDLLKVEPYGVRYDGPFNPDEPLRKLALDTYALAGVNSLFDTPSVRADWFIDAATHAPLYDHLQQLDGKDRRHPPFDLGGVDDPLAHVVQVYRLNDVDVRVAAAELGLGTVAALDARWPPDKSDPRQALDAAVPRSRWAGDDGHALFAEYVRVLKLGVPRAVQPPR